jgi:hypothetical protein
VLDGDLVLQQSARSGASVATMLQARLALPQPAIDLPRTDWSVLLKALLPLWMPWVRKRYRLKPPLEEQLLSKPTTGR